MKKILFLFLFLFFAKPALAVQTELGEVGDFGDYISGIWEWASQIIFAISVLMMIIGGMVLMFSGDRSNYAENGKIIIKSAIISTFLTTSSAFLMNFLQKPTIGISEKPKVQDITIVVQNSVSLIFNIISILAVIAVIYNGYLLMFSGANYDNEEKAKKGFNYAIIGLVVAISAKLILRFIIAPVS
jgi:uncharacterized membrane protein